MPVHPEPSPLAGFGSEFSDLPDYILQITERIWEGRDLAGIRRWYADDIVLRSPTGLVRGNGPVVASSLATLAEFGDRRLPGEDVIWTGDAADGFLSSHRLMCWMTHASDGAYGPATGRVARYRIIAECFVRANQVHEEWLARDQAAIAIGLGTSPRALAERQVAAGNGGYFTPAADAPGRYEALIDDSGAAGAVAGAWRRIFAEQDLSAVAQHYAPAATLEGPGGAGYTGHAAIDRFFLRYLAAFPRAAFTVRHLFARENPGRPARVAMRWSLDGAHEGWGAFGPPSGRPVHVMGFTHAELADGKVSAEWVVTDEVAIWKQILAR